MWWWDNADTYSNTYCYSDGHGFDYTDAETDAYAEVCANTETSSYSSAKTVVV